MNFLEKTRNKIMHFLFPYVARFFSVISLVLLLAAWFIPETYWQIKMVLFFLWYVNCEIYWAGIMDRDYLSIQSARSHFYHIYRFVNGVFPLFLLIFLVIMLIPGPLWLKNIFCGVFVMAGILRAIGDRIYRPKKPEE